MDIAFSLYAAASRWATYLQLPVAEKYMSMLYTFVRTAGRVSSNQRGFFGQESLFILFHTFELGADLAGAGADQLI